MTTAIVESRVKLTSVDRASKNINKSNTALGRTSKALDKAAKKSTEMGGALRSAMSGDVLGSVNALKSAFSGSAGLTAAIAGGTAVIAAAGAAAAIAAVKFTNWSVQINRIKAGAEAAFGPEGLGKAIAISDTLGGVSAESITKVATRLKLAGVSAEFTGDQLLELTQRATVAGKTGDEALSALAASIEKGNARALKLVGTFINSAKVINDLSKETGVAVGELEEYAVQAAIVAAIQENLNKKLGATTAAHDRQDTALSKLDNAWLKLKVTLSDTAGGPMVAVVEHITEMINLTGQLGEVIVNLGRVAIFPLIAMINAQKKAWVGLAAVVVKLIELDFSGSLATAKVALRDLGNSIESDTIGVFDELYESVKRVGDETAKVTADLKVGGGLSAAFDVQQNIQNRFAQVKVKKGGGAAGGKVQKSVKQDEFAADFAAGEKLWRAEEAVDLAREAHKNKLLELDKQRTAMFRANAERIHAVRVQEAMDSERSRKANIQNAQDTATSMINAAESMGAALVVIAGLRAGYALAVGIMAVAEKGYAGIPQLIAGIAAAAQFAAVAGKSPPSVSPAVGGGGLSSPGQSTASTNPGQQNAGPTVVNLFGVANTKAELGHAISRANQAAEGTGMVPA